MRIGLDIGGTKTELIALDSDGGKRLGRRVATPHGDYDAALAALAGLVHEAENELGSRASVGVGLPGTVSPRSGLVANAYATPYNGKPLQVDLEQLLERDIRVENDANCFALSEAVDGAAHGAGVVFGAILGTGAGGGIVVEDGILRGANRGAGEWGHNPLPWMTPEEYPGTRCYCGRTGCIERFVSGPALAADHARASGESLEPAQIAARAAAGDVACAASLVRLEQRLARALAHVINLIDPDVIVLGGGLSNIERLYTTVPELWGEYIYAASAETRLVRAAHGDASGVRGAARLWDA
ncbi:MAG: ROK family protein [Betaproteobacteria bacterium]